MSLLLKALQRASKSRESLPRRTPGSASPAATTSTGALELEPGDIEPLRPARRALDFGHSRDAASAPHRRPRAAQPTRWNGGARASCPHLRCRGADFPRGLLRLRLPRDQPSRVLHALLVLAGPVRPARATAAPRARPRRAKRPSRKPRPRSRWPPSRISRSPPSRRPRVRSKLPCRRRCRHCRSPSVAGHGCRGAGGRRTDSIAVGPGRIGDRRCATADRCRCAPAPDPRRTDDRRQGGPSAPAERPLEEGVQVRPTAAGDNAAARTTEGWEALQRQDFARRSRTTRPRSPPIRATSTHCWASPRRRGSRGGPTRRPSSTTACCSSIRRMPRHSPA